MAAKPILGVTRTVRPLLSTNSDDARKRVIALYKAFYRIIPDSILWYKLPLTISKARQILKNEFLKNKDIKDIRVIDMLVVKGEMQLQELVMKWMQGCHIMNFTKVTHNPKPKTFLAKFLAGND